MELRIAGSIVILLCIWSITCIGVQAKDNGEEHSDDSITTQSKAGNTNSTVLYTVSSTESLEETNESASQPTKKTSELSTAYMSNATPTLTTETLTTDLTTENLTTNPMPQPTETTTQEHDEVTSTYTSTTFMISTVNTTPENAPSATPATSVNDNRTSNKSHNDTSTTSLNSQTITTATYSQPFTGQGRSKSASTPALVIMTTLSSTVSRPDKLITIHITEIFVDKNGKEQIELKVLGNKAKLSHYSVHFFCGKTMSHYYNIQLSEDNVNEEGYLLMTDDHINLEEYLERNGSVSLAVYYNKPNKVIMDNEGLVDAVVITTDHNHVPKNLPSLTLHYGNFIITTKLSDIKNGFTAMRCSDSKAWKKGRQSTLGKPNPTCHSATNSDSSNKIKVTVAVVSTCLVIFFIIVIMVIVYMRRKQEGIRHFQLSPLSDDDDELILNMEHPSEEYTSGSEPTFDNDFYSKMRKL